MDRIRPDSWIPQTYSLPSLEALLALESDPPPRQLDLFDEPSDDRAERVRRALKACQGKVTTADRLRRARR